MPPITMCSSSEASSFSTRKLATPNIAGSLQLKENLHRSTVPQIATSNSRHFRSTNHCIRYAFVVDQRNVNENIFSSKKSKQRYLDYVYKVGLKRVFGRLIQAGKLKPSSVSGLFIRFDEHTTATDGRYELREAIEQEFKFGTHNFKYNTFHPPLFPGMQGTVHLEFRDSKNDALIRASDIIANQMWYHEISGQFEKMEGKAIVVRFP